MTRIYPANMDLESDDISLSDVCAAEWAAYKQALDRVIDLDPVRLMPSFGHPVALLDEAANALLGAGWHYGVRAAQATRVGVEWQLRAVGRRGASHLSGL